MRPWSIALVLVVSACGASWGLGGEDGDVLYTQCAEPKTYYLDVDRDGWGDSDVEGFVNECDPPAEYSATNNRDCDDGDVTNTGLVGSVCPRQLVPSTSDVPFGTLVGLGSEFAFVYGEDTPVVTAIEAETNCELWGAARLEDVLGEQQWSSTGHLATFKHDDDSLARTQQVIEQTLGPGGVFAAYVGIQWNGTVDGSSGAWEWASYEEDEADNSLIDIIGFCGDELVPEDFFPGLNPGATPGEGTKGTKGTKFPPHKTLIQEEMDSLRLALVLDESGEWCLGMPEDAGEGYGFDEGHLLCERAPPSPADYEPDYVETGDNATN